MLGTVKSHNHLYMLVLFLDGNVASHIPNPPLFHGQIMSGVPHIGVSMFYSSDLDRERYRVKGTMPTGLFVVQCEQIALEGYQLVWSCQPSFPKLPTESPTIQTLASRPTAPSVAGLYMAWFPEP